MRPELVILIKARAKIADPANWGKGIRSVRGGHRGLETCCAVEAITDCETPSTEYLRGAALRALRQGAGISYSDDITGWNDVPSRTHAEVLAAFDKAIASAS